jgi:integrase
MKKRIDDMGHHAGLPYRDIPVFMAALRDRRAVGARALEFTILTVARTVETIGATWGEVNLHTNAWLIPRHRIRAGTEHKVPLGNRAVAIVKEMAAIRFNDFIFAGVHGGLSRRAMVLVLERLGRSDVTVDGFRSTFRAWAAEGTAYSNPVIRRALSRGISNEVKSPRRRQDLFAERARLMNDWTKYCTLGV